MKESCQVMNDTKQNADYKEDSSVEITKTSRAEKTADQDETEAVVMNRTLYISFNKLKNHRATRNVKPCTKLDNMINVAMRILGNRLNTNCEAMSLFITA